MVENFRVSGKTQFGAIKTEYFDNYDEAYGAFRKALAWEASLPVTTFKIIIDEYCQKHYSQGAPEEFSLLKETLQKLHAAPKLPEYADDLKYFSFEDENVKFDMSEKSNKFVMEVKNSELDVKFPQAEISVFKTEELDDCIFYANENFLLFVDIRLENLQKQKPD